MKKTWMTSSTACRRRTCALTLALALTLTLTVTVTVTLALTLTLTLTLTLQAENLRLRTHHLRPGGVLFYFFLYDLLTTSLLFAWVLSSNWRNGISRGDWRYNTSLYFTKVALGLGLGLG